MFALGVTAKLAAKEQRRLVTPIMQTCRLDRFMVREPADGITIVNILYRTEGKEEALIYAAVPAAVFYPAPPPLPKFKATGGGISTELLALAAGMLTEGAKLTDASQRRAVYDKTVDLLIDAETDDGDEESEAPSGPRFNMTLVKGSELVTIVENAADATVDFGGAYYGQAMSVGGFPPPFTPLVLPGLPSFGALYSPSMKYDPNAEIRPRPPFGVDPGDCDIGELPPRTRLLPVRWEVELPKGESKTLEWTAQARGWVSKVTVHESAAGVIVGSVKTEPLRNCPPGTVRYEAGDVVLITLCNTSEVDAIVPVLATMEMFV